MPVLIEIKNHYESSLRYAYRLDDAVMEHHNHEEAGGWGVHWRLDEVLRLVFPRDHDVDRWPKMPWYQHSEAENNKVVVAGDGEEYVDQRRRELIHEVNSHPKTKRQFELLGVEVWDTQELKKDFDILGFRAPFVVVERLDDGVRGSLMFQQEPRLYFEFRTDRIL